MSVLELRVYAEDDPNGTALGTLTDADLISAEIRIGLHDVGAGSFSISRHHADADLIQANRLVKVVVPSVSASPIFAFWLRDGSFGLIDADEEGGETLDFTGPGVLDVLALARLYFTPYAPDQPHRGSVSEDGIWKWIDEPYGAILTRIIEEGQEQPGSPLQDVTIDFDRTDDSDGVDWPHIDEEFEERIGTDVLTVMERLRQAGNLFIIGNPDLSINVFQSYGRDLTGSFGAGNVRFQKGVNILTRLQRDIAARAEHTHLILEDSDGAYSLEVKPGFSGRAHWGYFAAGQTNDDTLLNAIGQDVIRASATSVEALELEWTPGFDEVAGRYMPGPEGTDGHVWIGDTITLHTGSGDHDYNAAAQLVVGLRIVLDEASSDSDDDAAARSLHCVAELNYQSARASRPRDAEGPHAGSHLKLCDATTDPDAEVFRPVAIYPGVSTTTAQDNRYTRVSDGNPATYAYENYPSGWIEFRYSPAITPTYVVLRQQDGNETIGIGGFGKSSAEDWKLQYWNSGSSTWIDTGTTFTGYARDYDGAVVGGFTSDRWRIVQTASAYTGPDARNGWKVEEFALTSGVGAPDDGFGAGLNPYAGISPRASRCDHSHSPDDHEHEAVGVEFTPAGSIAAGDVQAAIEEVATDAAAGVTAHTGDATDAHNASAISFVPDGSIASTNVQAAIQEVRDEAAAGGGAPSDPTYLVGAAHAGLSAEIVVGSTPGGELGGTWASPTVDASHSGSTHAATQAAAEATAAAALAAHLADVTAVHDAASIGFTPAGTIAATNVQAALEEVAAESDVTAHLGDATDAHDASAVSFTPNGSISSTDVQAAIVEVRDEAAIAGGDISAHIADATDAHAASAISIVDAGGLITATQVEAALQELAARKLITHPELIDTVKASPNTPDDDFAAGTLDAKWTLVDGAAAANPLKIIGNADIGTYRLGQRNSWLLTKGSTTAGDNVWLRQDYTLPDGACIVMPVEFSVDKVVAPGNNETWIGVGLNTNDATMASAECLRLFMDTDAGTFKTTYAVGTAAGTAVGDSSQIWLSGIGGLFYLRIDRVGLVYHGFVSHTGRSWVYLASHTAAAAFTNIWLFHDTVITVANPVVLGVPWIRQGVAEVVDPWPF